MLISVEPGGFLFLKRAKRNEVCAGPLKREIRANDIDDVAGGADLFECCRRKKSSHEGKPGWRRLLFRTHDVVDVALASTAEAFMSDSFAGGGINVNQFRCQILFDRAAGQGPVE